MLREIATMQLVQLSDILLDHVGCDFCKTICKEIHRVRKRPEWGHQ